MRPREFALLLLSSGELLPRQRLRSQTPDSCGLELKRRLLEAIAALDPEPEDVEATLERLVSEVGSAGGPLRALALAFRDEWQALPANPRWAEFLRSEAERQREGGKLRARDVQP